MGMPCPVNNIQFAIIQEISLFVFIPILYMSDTFCEEQNPLPMNPPLQY